MEQQLSEIRDQQRASWNKFSPGWKKWDDLFMDFLKPMGEEIIGSLDLKETDHVLDIAAGTGEPGLTIAKKVNKGKVVITDLAEEMVKLAAGNANKKGLRNVETLASDVSELPFRDSTFDAVSCRLGFMFFPDMQRAAQEMVRVLKPGGRLATSVWDVADRNFWVTAMMSTINRNIEIPPPAPGAPGMFRCAQEGFIAGLFSAAGLKNVRVAKVTGTLKALTPEVYWDAMTEVAAPVVAALGKTDDATRAKIKMEVMQLVDSKYPEGKVIIDGGSLVISGTK